MERSMTPGQQGPALHRGAEYPTAHMNDLTKIEPGTSALVLYEAARQALAKAVSTDEVQEIRAEAEALRAYARIANNKQMEADAVELRMRAVRRLGKLMAQQKEGVGANKGGRPTKKTGLQNNPVSSAAPPTLTEAGIDKNLANQARKLSSIPEEEFEAGIKEMREGLATTIDKASLKMVSPTPQKKPKPKRDADELAPQDPEDEDDEPVDPANFHAAFRRHTELASNAASDCRDLLGNPDFSQHMKKDVARETRAVATAWSALALELEQS